MSVRAFGLIVIGDEILRGKRQDKHFAHAIDMLRTRGLDLAWCRIIGDVEERITRTLRETLANDDVVFCCGGLGNTPDDLTRPCAARAAGVELVRHPDAVAEIEGRFGAGAYPTRILMADVPQGSRIIPNPYNRVPGFSFDHHHFLPGFPQMAWPMMEWVMDTYYRELADPDPPREKRLRLTGIGEGDLLDLMQALVARYPGLGLSSLPELREGGPRLEFGLRARSPVLEPAWVELLQALAARGLVWEEL